MNNSRIQVKQIKDHIYLLDDNREATGYLVIGDTKALVIDTMNGHADVKAVVRNYTDKPIMVVNTHGHCDHIFGNIYFEEAYLHPADRQLAEKHSHFPEFLEETAKLGLTMPPFKEIMGGEIIDLGGITIEVVELPGHTRGSILLLDREDRILFTGDAINRHLWLQLEESLPLEESLEKLESVVYLTEQADSILHGHATDPEPVTLITELRDGLKDLVAGNTENDTDYEWFGPVAKLHPFAGGKSAIVYAPKSGGEGSRMEVR